MQPAICFCQFPAECLEQWVTLELHWNSAFGTEGCPGEREYLVQIGSESSDLCPFCSEQSARPFHETYTRAYNEAWTETITAMRSHLPDTATVYVEE